MNCHARRHSLRHAVALTWAVDRGAHTSAHFSQGDEMKDLITKRNILIAMLGYAIGFYSVAIVILLVG